MVTLRLCHLYPEVMNIYADRGNIAVFAKRLAWRGHDLAVTEIGVGDLLPPDHDLYYLGGGQDRDQAIVARDLAGTKAVELHQAADDNAAMLFVCGGIQLAGHGYVDASSASLPGVGLLDLTTAAGENRLIGDVVIEATIDGETKRVVGYENHGGRTMLGPDARPLGRVVEGHGNNGDDATEGAIRDRVIGTYLHGPLLPKNPWLADILLRWGLEHATGSPVEVDPLDDTLELAAHHTATTRVGVKR